MSLPELLTAKMVLNACWALQITHLNFLFFLSSCPWKALQKAHCRATNVWGMRLPLPLPSPCLEGQCDWWGPKPRGNIQRRNCLASLLLCGHPLPQALLLNSNLPASVTFWQAAGVALITAVVSLFHQVRAFHQAGGSTQLDQSPP
jgi:hypothetical protein